MTSSKNEQKLGENHHTIKSSCQCGDMIVDIIWVYNDLFKFNETKSCPKNVFNIKL